MNTEEMRQHFEADGRPRRVSQPDGLCSFGLATCSLPRRPWVAAQQYSMRFVVSADNEIVLRADHLPMGMLRAMAEAANKWAENAELSHAAGDRDVASGKG